MSRRGDDSSCKCCMSHSLMISFFPAQEKQPPSFLFSYPTSLLKLPPTLLKPPKLHRRKQEPPPFPDFTTLPPVKDAFGYGRHLAARQPGREPVRQSGGRAGRSPAQEHPANKKQGPPQPNSNPHICKGQDILQISQISKLASLAEYYFSNFCEFLKPVRTPRTHCWTPKARLLTRYRALRTHIYIYIYMYNRHLGLINPLR